MYEFLNVYLEKAVELYLCLLKRTRRKTGLILCLFFFFEMFIHPPFPRTKLLLLQQQTLLQKLPLGTKISHPQLLLTQLGLHQISCFQIELSDFKLLCLSPIDKNYKC